MFNLIMIIPNKAHLYSKNCTPRAGMASFAWLSVTVKQGLELLQKPKIVKCIWEESFGEVLERLDSSYREMTVLKISIGQDVCFKGAQMVSIDSPILLCEQFNCKFVCYDLKPGVASGSMVAMPTDQRRNGLVLKFS